MFGGNLDEETRSMQAHRKLCSKVIILVGFFRRAVTPQEICNLYKILPRPLILPLSARSFLRVTESLAAFADRQLPTHGFRDLAELPSS